MAPLSARRIRGARRPRDGGVAELRDAVAVEDLRPRAEREDEATIRGVARGVALRGDEGDSARGPFTTT